MEPMHDPVAACGFSRASVLCFFGGGEDVLGRALADQFRVVALQMG
jgi:hypothetical protein